MNDFIDRLSISESFERIFIEIFNKYCKNYKIVKFGIESTALLNNHSNIRFCYDDGSKFIRYLPDSVLINIENPSKCKTTLIEFKVATTGIKKDLFFKKVKQECPEIAVKFTCREDIINIENDALELYRKLNKINVKTILIIYAQYRPSEDQIRVQFAEKIAICNTYNPNLRGQNTGSGTLVANVNFLSFEPVIDFFNKNFNVKEIDLENIINDLQKICKEFNISS